MSCSVILKKEQHWYILPEMDDREELILSLIKNENPNFVQLGQELSEILKLNGWVLEECRNLTEVA